MTAPAVSFILCTYNPDPTCLAEVLDRIRPQLEAVDGELVLVDNNSSPALEFASFAVPADRARLIVETRQGLANARSKGISESRARLLIFVDDDNILDADYARQALKIAASAANVGVFAGRARGRFTRKPGWLHRRHIARYAIRDLGDTPITAAGDCWSEAEPYGAGMVVRREVAEAFVRINEAFDGKLPLGRRGQQIASGEDSLFSRIAHRLGYAVAYRPELSLEHVIDPRRLSLSYLFRLVEGQARSHVILEAAEGRMSHAPAPTRLPLALARRFLSRLRTPGLHEALTHIWWDMGFFDQRARLTPDGASALGSALASLSRHQPVD